MFFNDVVHAQRLSAFKLGTDGTRRVSSLVFQSSQTDDIDHEQQPTFLYLLDCSCQLFEESEEVLCRKHCKQTTRRTCLSREFFLFVYINFIFSVQVKSNSVFFLISYFSCISPKKIVIFFFLKKDS